MLALRLQYHTPIQVAPHVRSQMTSLNVEFFAYKVTQ